MSAFRVITSALLIIISLSSFAQEQEKKSKEENELNRISGDAHTVDLIDHEVLEDNAVRNLLETLYPGRDTNFQYLKDAKALEKAKQKALYDNKVLAPLTEIIELKTSPGALPPTIKIAPYQATALTILDVTGSPWPISAFNGGYSENFTVSKLAGHAYDNVLDINSSVDYGNTNINLSLVGMTTLVTIQVVTSTTEYHPAPIIQIDKVGPQGKRFETVTPSPLKFDEVLRLILLGGNGIPEDFTKVDTNNSLVEAWQNEEYVFVRTTLNPRVPIPRGIKHGGGSYKSMALPKRRIMNFKDDQGHNVKVKLEL